MKTNVTVNIDELRVWSDNPRAGLLLDDIKNLSEKMIINVLIDVVGEDKMFRLAQDIVANSGLMASVLPVVVKKDDFYYVYDGNRRISCIKMIVNPNIIESVSLKNKIKRLITDDIDLNKLCSINVYETDEEEAFFIMDRTHNGENGGVGVIPWDSYQRDISLVKRGLSPKYQIAYNVSNILGFKYKNDFKNIYYTDIERIFKSKTFMATFDIKNYDVSEVLIVTNAYNSLLEYKRIMNIKSFSRYFNIVDSGSEEDSNKPIRNFCEWYKEKEKNKGTYILKSKDIELYEDQFFSLDMVNFEIFNNKGEQVIWSVSDQDIYIKYINPNGKEVNKLNMKQYGKWLIEFVYKGNQIKSSIKIKPLETPRIELVKEQCYIVKGNSLNIEDLYRAYGCHGEDIKKKVSYKIDKNAYVDKNIFLGSNSQGNYIIDFLYGSISKRLEIIVNEKINTIETIKINKIFVFDSKVQITFDSTVCGLVGELNDNSFSITKFPNLFCCSVRSIVELTLKYLSRASIIEFKKKDLGEKIKEMIDYYLKSGLSKLCVNYSNIFDSYNNYKNALSAIDVPKMASILNVGAHTAGQLIDVKSMLELCQKTISLFIVLAEYIGKC